MICIDFPLDLVCKSAHFTQCCHLGTLSTLHGSKIMANDRICLRFHRNLRKIRVVFAGMTMAVSRCAHLRDLIILLHLEKNLEQIRSLAMLLELCKVGEVSKWQH